MLEFHQTMTIPPDHILRLNLPEFQRGAEVEVIVYPKQNGDDPRIAQIALAAKDPLFLQDIQEIADDFKYVDSEHI
jgi:hypothetical protein